MRILALLLVVFLVGFALGWVLSPGPYRFTYTTKRAIMLVPMGKSGNPIGSLPAGVPLLCEKKLDPRGEIGWFGYINVYFGVESEEAAELVAPALRPRPSILRNYLRGDPIPYVIRAYEATSEVGRPIAPGTAQPSSATSQ